MHLSVLGDRDCLVAFAAVWTLPACEVTIDTLSLVVQDGPEQLWNWRVAGTVGLLSRPSRTV